jgi:hypothetical protein
MRRGDQRAVRQNVGVTAQPIGREGR